MTDLFVALKELVDVLNKAGLLGVAVLALLVALSVVWLYGGPP